MLRTRAADDDPGRGEGRGEPPVRRRPEPSVELVVPLHDRRRMRPLLQARRPDEGAQRGAVPIDPMPGEEVPDQEPGRPLAAAPAEPEVQAVHAAAPRLQDRAARPGIDRVVEDPAPLVPEVGPGVDPAVAGRRPDAHLARHAEREGPAVGERDGGHDVASRPGAVEGEAVGVAALADVPVEDQLHQRRRDRPTRPSDRAHVEREAAGRDPEEVDAGIQGSRGAAGSADRLEERGLLCGIEVAPGAAERPEPAGPEEEACAEAKGGQVDDLDREACRVVEPRLIPRRQRDRRVTEAERPDRSGRLRGKPPRGHQRHGEGDEGRRGSTPDHRLTPTSNSRMAR